MEQLLAGIGIIACMVTWRYMWLPSTLDTARDRLFDIRDKQVRAWFVERNMPLDHPIYKALRDLLNGMLKNTESLTLIHVGALIAWQTSNPEREAKWRQEIDRRFETDDPELKTLIKEVREQATMVMLEYVVETSGPALLLAMMIFIVKFFGQTLSTFKSLFFSGNSCSPMLASRLAAVLLSVATLLGVTNRATAQATLEEKALSIHCSV